MLLEVPDGLAALPPLRDLWADDLLTIYARGIAACYRLYFEGNAHQVEDILPLYRDQTTMLALQSSSLQYAAARLASQAQQLTCELATDREDFRVAQQSGQQALEFARLAGDANLQVTALISLANIGFHRKLSAAALHSYKQAVSLLNDHVTPLLKGRTYAGLAEVYAMRKDLERFDAVIAQLTTEWNTFRTAYELYFYAVQRDNAAVHATHNEQERAITS